MKGGVLMAIDKTKTKFLLEEIDGLFDVVAKNLKPEARRWLRDRMLGPALSEIEELISEARPPVLYLVGRSGHGKSSVLNALSGKHVASVGDIKPETAESIPYTILFEKAFAAWRVIDTRGIFETTNPNGGPADDVVRLIVDDLVTQKPDVILHVIAATEARNLAMDFKAFKQMRGAAQKAFGVAPPCVIVLNKVDTLKNPRDWPPEASPRKAGLIDQCLSYMSRDVLGVETKSINGNVPFKGMSAQDEAYIGIIPVSALEDDLWNIDTLRDFIGVHLPISALLDYTQAIKRKTQLKRLSHSLTKRFSTIAGTIGSSPIPVSDIAILTPLQLLLIIVIGGLSCRSFEKSTAIEFFSACGINVGAAIGLKVAAQQLVKLIPLAGPVISGIIAGGSTYGLGRAAELYFFDGESKKPESFEKEWEEQETI